MLFEQYLNNNVICVSNINCWTNNIVEHCSQQLLQYKDTSQIFFNAHETMVPSRGWQWDRNYAFTGKMFVCDMLLWWSVWYLPVIWYCDGQYDICLWYGIVMVSMVFACDMVLWWSVWYLSVIWYCDGQYRICLWHGIVMVWHFLWYAIVYDICMWYGIAMVWYLSMIWYCIMMVSMEFVWDMV